jgi:hypothetical protein
LCDLFLSLELRNHILETNSHFTPELLICAAGDLTMSNLAYTACLLESHCQKLLVSINNSFISLISSWVEGLLVLGFWPSLYVTLCILHFSHAFQGSATRFLFPFVGCSQGFRFKDMWSNLFLSFTKFFLKGYLQWSLWLMALNCP